MVYFDEKFSVHGYIPVKVDNVNQDNLKDAFSKLEFIIEGKIARQMRNIKTKLDTYQERISMFEYKRSQEKNQGE